MYKGNQAIVVLFRKWSTIKGNGKLYSGNNIKMVNLISGQRLAPARSHLHRRAFLPKPKRAQLRLKSSFFFQKTYFLDKKAGNAFAN
ncbi:MAG: hypothetical protein MSH66_04530 [Bacteroidales bacterium]|nr:hypothetical protein [Bacteroidales bacterium]